MRLQVDLQCLLHLILLSLSARAGFLHLRQEDTTDAAPSPMESPERPTLPTGSPSNSSGSANSSQSSNSSASASSKVASLNATFDNELPAALNTTDDPNACHKTPPSTPGDSTFNPFCLPEQGYEEDVSVALGVSWDTGLFNESDVATVYVLKSSDAQNTTRMNVLEVALVAAPLFPDAVLGGSLDLNSTWLNGSASLNVTFFLDVETIDGSNNETAYLGPWMIITDKNASNTTSSASSRSKKIGEGVGIPIGTLAFIAVIAAIVFFLWRKRRNGKGYGASKSFAQRTASGRGGGGGGGGGGAARGHARQASFHDEPTRGVELQDRNKGGEDNWGWGSPVSSPTSARHSNAFRDEISRQQTGRAM